MNRPTLLALLAPALFAAPAASAQGQQPVQLEALSSVSAIEPGATFQLAVSTKIDPGWHIYWRNPGQSGLPTVITWTLPEGFSQGATSTPIPTRYKQEFDGDFSMVSHTFEDEAVFVTEVTAGPSVRSGGEATFSAKVEWQACKEVCTPPMETPLTISLPILDAGVPSPDAALIAKALEASEAGAVEARAIASMEDGQLELVVAVPEASADQYDGDLYFLPAAAGLIEAGNDQISVREGVELSIWADLSDGVTALPKTLEGLIVGEGAPPLRIAAASTSAPAEAESQTDSAPKVTGSESPAGKTFTYPPKDSPEAEGIRDAIRQLASGIEKKSISLFLMLAGAFLGGIILNLMPCVFPVLGIKILGFVQQAGSDKAKVRRHGWVFAAGVILSLWALVGVLFIIRAAGASAGWGFQLQEPVFVIFLIAIMFTFALNLSGVFELGTSLTGAGSGLQAQHGYGGSFFSGVLAVLVATPCTGPFMGPALGFALSGPVYIGFAIFTALAVGLALPYVVLSYFPALIEKLPRPGAWMETFKQFMAFPLYATVVWLLAVLGKGNGQGAILWTLIGLIVLAMGLWIYGRYSTPLKKSATRWTARVAAAAAVVAFFLVAHGSIDGANSDGANVAKSKIVHGLEYEPFDPRVALEYVRQGKDVLNRLHRRVVSDLQDQ